MTKKDVTNEEIMTALTQFAGSVDARFEAMDARFEAMDARFGAMDARFDRLESDVADIKTSVDRIYGILDAHMARIERIIEENSVQSHQQERLQRWIFQLADEAGIKLKYD